MLKRFLLIGLGIIMAGITALPQFSYATEAEAKAFVDRLIERTISIISDTKNNDASKSKKLEAVFSETVDMKWTGRFAIGKYWRQASDQQKTRYMDLYSDYLLLSYIPKFREYTGQKIQVDSIRKDTDDEYTVFTQIVNADPNKPAVKVDYRIRKYKDGKYRIFDIIAEGVSLIATQRSDFGETISSKGVDGLLTMLEQRIQKLSAEKNLSASAATH